MLTRVRGLILTPGPTWATIGAEEPPGTRLLLTWVLPLAALAGAGTLLRFVLWSVIMGAEAAASIAPYALRGFGLQVVGAVVSVAVTGVLAAFLAPWFGGRREWARGVTWVAYAATPALLAGALAFLPGGAWLGVVGAVWSVYLLSEGATPVMTSDEARRYPYTATLVVTVLLVAFLLSLLSRCGRVQVEAPVVTETAKTTATPTTAPSAMDTRKGGRERESKGERDKAAPNGTLVIDDEAVRKAKAALDELMKSKEKAAFDEKMKDVARETRRLPAGSKRTSDLESLLPERALDLPRRSVESHYVPPVEGKAPAFAEAKAAYGGRTGEPSIRIEVGDGTPWAMGMASMKRAAVGRDVDNARVRDSWRVEGDYLLNVRWDKTRREGTFMVLVADRFALRVVVGNRPEDPEAAERIARQIDWSELKRRAAGEVR